LWSKVKAQQPEGRKAAKAVRGKTTTHERGKDRII